MALKFNPFESDKPQKTPKVGRQVSRHRVFDSPEIPEEQAIGKIGKTQNKELETNRGQSGDKVGTKLETNRGQSGDKVGTKLETNRGQSGDKVGTKLRKELSSMDKVETEVGTKLETNRGQSGDKVGTKRTFSSLLGLRRRLIIILYESCIANRSHLTESLTIEFLASTSNSTSASVKKTLQRLQKENFLNRVDYKDGRGGSTVYELHENIFQDILRGQTRDKLETNRGQSGDKVGTQLETQLETSTSSSSSNLYINNTSTQGEYDCSIFEFSSLAEFSISDDVLRRAFKLYPNLSLIEPSKIQDLLFRYAEYLKDPKNKVQNARGFLISLLKQLSEGQAPLESVNSIEERLARKFIEEQKRLQAERDAIIHKAKELGFEEWIRGLTQEQIDQLAPPNLIFKSGSDLQKKALRGVFEKTVFKNE